MPIEVAFVTFVTTGDRAVAGRSIRHVHPPSKTSYNNRKPRARDRRARASERLLRFLQYPGLDHQVEKPAKTGETLCGSVARLSLLEPYAYCRSQSLTSTHRKART